MDVGEEFAADSGKYRICTVYVFNTDLRKEDRNV
jgi:hypothetical protein